MKRTINNNISPLLFITSALLPIRGVALTQLPNHCLKQNVTCALQGDSSLNALETPTSLDRTKKVSLMLFDNAAIYRESSGLLLLLSGDMVFLNPQGQSPSQIRSVFVDIKFSGELFARVDKDRILLRNISGEVELTLRDRRKLLLPRGFEISVAGLGANRESQFEVMRKIDLADHLKYWRKYFRGSQSNFKAAAEQLKEEWRAWQSAEIESYRQVASQGQAQSEVKAKMKELSVAQAEEADKLRKRTYLRRAFSR